MRTLHIWLWVDRMRWFFPLENWTRIIMRVGMFAFWQRIFCGNDSFCVIFIRKLNPKNKEHCIFLGLLPWIMAKQNEMTTLLCEIIIRFELELTSSHKRCLKWNFLGWKLSSIITITLTSPRIWSKLQNNAATSLSLFLRLAHTHTRTHTLYSNSAQTIK